MENSYINSPFANRAIYPARFLPYVSLLIVFKFLRAFGLFLSYDLLKLINVVQFLFFTKAGSAGILLLMQKPFSGQRAITRHQWFRIMRHALFGNLIQLLWLFGLTLCGPLRTVLLTEHSDLVVIAGASALFSSAGGPSKFRGAIFFLIGVLALLLFDYDDIHGQTTHHSGGDGGTHVHSGILTHLFDHLTSITGLSDHKGGVIVLFFTLCIHAGYNSAAKRLSVDIGGSKRLHALSTLCGAGMLMPWALLLFITQETFVTSWLSMLFPLFLVVLLVFVFDFYIEAVCVARLEVARTHRLATISIILAALFLSSSWNHPFVSLVTTLRHVQEIAVEEHMMSGGVVFSVVMFIYATVILTGPQRGSKGSFIGYTATGVPLYSFTEDALAKTSQSALIIAKNGLRQILEDSDSRKIFYFLCINLFFTFVELVYGVWTNSLGLISDGFHMLFDCSALVMGLYAAIMARWKPTRIFSYGYDRVELLSGFINGLFLMVIAFFVFIAALSRMFDPPEIITERLLAVSIIGLLVNLVGIKAFHHGHSHGGGGHGHSHASTSHGHGHSHGNTHSSGGGPGAHGSHGHSHAHAKSHGHSHGGSGSGSITDNKNMQGVFLHILADTMGSVGVIVSTILIEMFGLNIADPICSLFIAVLIFLSVAPLVKDTTLMLLLRTPEDKQNELGLALEKVLQIEGVLSYRNEHFWAHSSKVMCGIIHVQVKQHVSEQKIISQMTQLFKETGVTNMSVQVEKEQFFQHLSGLGTSSTQVHEMTKGLRTLNYETTQNFIKAI